LQALEAEVKRLTLKLREKERSEGEFRRKILEYAAEIKVWKKKYEMQKLAATVEISEVKGNEEEISDIMEQLNNAAEKLTRLDAVKDLKLLQSEMETALKEISK
uniref:Not3 domain-containing protein n=1 Tax=Brugia pahangi TaxID=6280 RepID=A0A0N4T6D0_BRUPA